MARTVAGNRSIECQIGEEGDFDQVNGTEGFFMDVIRVQGKTGKESDVAFGRITRMEGNWPKGHMTKAHTAPGRIKEDN